LKGRGPEARQFIPERWASPSKTFVLGHENSGWWNNQVSEDKRVKKPLNINGRDKMQSCLR